MHPGHTRPLVPGDLQAGSGSGRLGVWKPGPAACWASGRGASGLLRIAPNRASGFPAGSQAAPSQARVLADGLFVFCSWNGYEVGLGPAGSAPS